jgi:hypothetical protein
MTRPVRKFRIRTRLKAWPLPGFTNSFSTIEHGSLSSMTFTPDRKSLVLMLDIGTRWNARIGRAGACKRPRIIAAARSTGHPVPEHDAGREIARFQGVTIPAPIEAPARRSRI